MYNAFEPELMMLKDGRATAQLRQEIFIFGSRDFEEVMVFNLWMSQKELITQQFFEETY